MAIAFFFAILCLIFPGLFSPTPAIVTSEIVESVGGGWMNGAIAQASQQQESWVSPLAQQSPSSPETPSSQDRSEVPELSELSEPSELSGPPESSRRQSTPTNNIFLKTGLVVLDGQDLFEVTAFQDRKTDQTITAATRANQVSQVLQVWAKRRQLPNIDVRDVRGATTITLDGQDLITVTKSDAIRDLQSPQEQADDWSNIIQAALTEAQARRRPATLWRSIAVATTIFALTCYCFWRLGQVQLSLSQHPINQLQQLLRGKVKRDGIPIHIRQVSLAIGLWALRYGWWAATIFYISQLFPATQKFGYELTQILLRSLGTKVFPLGDQAYSLIDLLILLVGFLILVVSSTVVTNLLRTRILQFAGIGSGVQQAIATLTRYTLIALGTMVILQLWGLDLSSLALLASSLGVGIGFGLQNIARDFGSGLILLFERPIQVGDFIEVGDFQGTVDRIGARSTMVNTLAQVAVIVPNSYFLENQVVNWSHDSPLSRIAIPIGVSYKTDPDLVQTLLLQAGNDHKGVRSIPHPQVLFRGFGDNALNFELLVWIIEPNRQPIIKSDLNFTILRLLRQHDIEIPYPQRDLHIRSGQWPMGEES